MACPRGGVAATCITNNRVACCRGVDWVDNRSERHVPRLNVGVNRKRVFFGGQTHTRSQHHERQGSNELHEYHLRLLCRSSSRATLRTRWPTLPSPQNK